MLLDGLPMQVIFLARLSDGFFLSLVMGLSFWPTL